MAHRRSSTGSCHYATALGDQSSSAETASPQASACVGDEATHAEKPLLDEQIRGAELVVGVMPMAAAFELARKAGLSLLQISAPCVSPPVCRIVDYGKY